MIPCRISFWVHISVGATCTCGWETQLRLNKDQAVVYEAVGHLIRSVLSNQQPLLRKRTPDVEAIEKYEDRESRRRLYDRVLSDMQDDRIRYHSDWQDATVASQRILQTRLGYYRI